MHREGFPGSTDKTFIEGEDWMNWKESTRNEMPEGGMLSEMQGETYMNYLSARETPVGMNLNTRSDQSLWKDTDKSFALDNPTSIVKSVPPSPVNNSNLLLKNSSRPLLSMQSYGGTPTFQELSQNEDVLNLFFHKQQQELQLEQQLRQQQQQELQLQQQQQQEPQEYQQKHSKNRLRLP